MTCKERGSIKEGIVLALVACFMFFIYAPIELLINNQEEFFYDIYILFPPILINFGLFFISSIFFFFFSAKKRVYYAMLYLYFVVFICSYVQGTFLVSWLPAIDGTLPDWREFPMERIKSVLVWVIVGVTFGALCKKLEKEKIRKIIVCVSSCIGLMLLVTLLVLCISTSGWEKKQILSTSTAENILSLSEEENVIILLLDAVDSSVTYQMLEENAQYRAIFEDFTYYTNTMSGYPYTSHSIPLILTGEWYEKQCEFEEFAKSAYSKSPLFDQLENNGYRMGVYETDFVVDASEQNRFDNILDCERGIGSWFTFCRWQIQLTGYRYAPFDLKRFCYVYTEAFNNLKVLPEEVELFEDSNLFFWDKLCNEEIEVVNDKCFRFIHVEGAHAPYRYDENMNISDKSSYEDGVKACLTMTAKYLEKLKDAGVYNNSCIIIMADHGQVAGFNDNPILFVKGFNEKHQMQMNDAPISHEDLQKAYTRLLAGFSSDELFDYKEGDYRERKFLFQDDDNNPLEIMEEYVQKGHAGNWDTLIKVREY